MKKKGPTRTPQAAHKPLKLKQMEELMHTPAVSHFIKHQPPERDVPHIYVKSMLEDRKKLEDLEAQLAALKNIKLAYDDILPQRAVPPPHESFADELERGELSPEFVSDDDRKVKDPLAQSHPPPDTSPA